MSTAIKFLLAPNISASDIHCQLGTVQGPNVMSENVMWQWVRFFKSGRTNIHIKRGVVGLVLDLVKKIDKKLVKIKDLPALNFLNNSCKYLVRLSPIN